MAATEALGLLMSLATPCAPPAAVRVPAALPSTPLPGAPRRDSPRPGAPRLGARDRSGPGHLFVTSLPWPLFAVIAVQAALSARLVWSNTAFMAALGPVLPSSGPVLLGSPSLAEYYLKPVTEWQRFSNTASLMLPSGRSISAPIGREGNPAVYLREISRSYFTIIALSGPATSGLDQRMAAYLYGGSHYRVVAQVPYGNGYYTIWEREQPAGARP